MTPYYERDGIRIYHADCRDVLPTIDPASVDLVLTDPPYGINLSNHGRSDSSYTVLGDHSQDIGIETLAMVPASAGLVVFASPMKPWPGKWRQHLVWDKGPAVGGGGDIATCWKFSWELIQVGRTRELNGPRDEAVLKYWVSPLDCKNHPSQKPVALLRYLIGKTTQPGAMILDPFMGSGSTLRAALDTGRHAIGIELEERYCEIAANRLAQAVLPMDIPA